MRYGEYSKSGEFVYDHPFQLGTKRTGTDLHRVGGKYPHFWHFRHMMEPSAVVAGSIMPPYQWLIENQLDTSLTTRKLEVMQQLGVPYTDADVAEGVRILNEQAAGIAEKLQAEGAPAGLADKEIIALIAYLQRLGTDIKGEK